MLNVVFLIREKLSGIVMDRDGNDFIADPVELAAALTCVVLAGDFFDDVHAVGDLTKYGVAVVEEGSRSGSDEELGTIGSGAGICHGENTGGAVTEVGMEFIGKLITRTATAALGRIATL